MLSRQLIEALANKGEAELKRFTTKLIEEQRRLTDRHIELDKEVAALEEAALELIKRRQAGHAN